MRTGRKPAAATATPSPQVVGARHIGCLLCDGTGWLPGFVLVWATGYGKDGRPVKRGCSVRSEAEGLARMAELPADTFDARVISCVEECACWRRVAAAAAATDQEVRRTRDGKMAAAAATDQEVRRTRDGKMAAAGDRE